MSRVFVIHFLLTDEGQAVPDQNEGEINAGGDSDAPEQTPPPILPPPVEGDKNREGDNDEPNRNEVKQTHVKPKHWTKYVEAVCAIALVCITGYYAKAAYRQAAASETAAQAASNAVCVALRTLRETQISNDRQANLAEQSLQANIDQFHRDQRAWLGTSDNTYTIVESGPIHSSVTVLNTGKSPATEIICRITGTTKPKGYVLRDSDIVYPTKLPTLKEGTIFPNQHFPLTAGGDPMEPNKQKIWFDKVQNGEWVQYFFGDVRYKDTFGVAHWTHFCSKYVPADKVGTPCPIYNNTDDSETKQGR